MGDIHNIFISISSNQAIISYINETSRENYIYHYYIYIPKCYDIYKNVNSTQELEFDLDELFDRKTNTKYYIKFNNLLQTYGNIKIGEEIIELTNNITEIKDGTKFYFISTNNNTGDNLPISYEISNEETYSSNCNIYLTIKDCYPSCKTCSKYDSDSNFLSQNCIECKEEDNYFPFPEEGSNCYKESEMASTFTQWFFDEENSIFKKCHPDCSLCNGTSDENCLICYNANLLLYNGKCIENCPENTFKNQENKKCEDCYKNCKTCGKLGYLYDMGCISCLEKEMIFNNYEINFYNCFKEYDNNTKSFYVSEEINNISSCFELYGRYIIENTYECIEKPDRGYFISNQTTGLLSPCPQNCFACNNSNICDLCENDYLIQEGKCVLSCSKGYYQYYNICLKYYQNNEDSNKGIVKSINQSTSLFEFKSIIKNNITGFVNSSNLINGSDFLAIISTSDNTDPKEQLKKGISSFNLDDCIEVIKTHYNISKEENLIILNIESKKNVSKIQEEKNINDNSFNLGKNIQIEIFDISGKKLDLSVCKENIKIMQYIGDVEELDFDSAKGLSDKGIDIFNAGDNYFNDICQNYDDDKDIILKDRREDIYINASFCQKGCTYNGMNYELMAANCICDSSLLQNSLDNITENNNKNSEENKINFNTLTKSIIANLFDFNLDVFKCYNLIFNLKILITNIGFYCMIFMFILQIIFHIIYQYKKLKSIRHFMLIFSNKNPKNIHENPPPKNNKSNSKMEIMNKQKNIIENNNNKNIFSQKKK